MNWSRASVGWGLLCLAGCTQAPPLPKLPERAPLGLDHVVLRDSLRPADVHEIFSAVNRVGKLRTLASLLQSLSISEMEELARALSRDLYEEAQLPGGLITRLEAHIAARDFTAWHRRIQGWVAEPDFRATREAILDLLSLDLFPELARRDSLFLDPRWREIFAGILSSGLDFREHAPWPTGRAAASSRAFVEDLKHFFSAMETREARADRDRLERLAEVFEREEFGTTLLKALSGARRGEGSAAFEGFARGMGVLLETPPPRAGSGVTNELELLVDLARALDGPANGLVLQAQKGLGEARDLVRELAPFLEPEVAMGIATQAQDGVLKPEDPDHTHDKEFWRNLQSGSGAKFEQAMSDLFLDLRGSIDSIVKSAQMTSQGEDLLPRLSGLINAFALTKWIQATAKANWAVWEKLPPDAFGKRMWELPLSPGKGGLELRFAVPTPPVPGDEQTEAYRLSPETVTEMTALGLGPVLPAYSCALSVEGSSRFTYRFTAPPAGARLGQEFQRAVAECDGIRPFVNLPGLLQIAISGFTGAPALRFSSRVLEQGNLLDNLNALLPSNLQTWRELDRLLFGTIRLGEIPAASRKVLLSLYGTDEKNAEKMAFILDAIHVVHAWDQGVQGLPSAFELYHRVVTSCRRGEVRSVGGLLSFLADSRLFSKAGSPGRPNYPAVQGWIRQGSSLARTLYALSRIEPEDRSAFLQPFQAALGSSSTPSGLSLHLQAANAILARHPEGISSIIDRVSGLEISQRPSPRARRDLEWLSRWLGNGRHVPWWRLAHSRLSRARLQEVAQELLERSRSGALREMLGLLLHVQNERMQRIAGVLQAWDRSGELAQFLASVELLLR